MKKHLLVVAALVSATLLSPAQAKEWKTLRFGVEGAYPPFSFVTTSGELKGFDIDIANALCKQLQAKCVLVQQEWDGMIPALLTRKYDAIIAAMSITEERKKKINFTDKYADLPNRFVVAKNNPLQLTKEGLAGKKIGVQRATTHEKYLMDNYGNQVTINRYGTPDEAFMDLKAGRVDALLAGAVAIDQGLLKKSGGDAYEFRGPDLTDPQWFGHGMGIAVRKGDDDLREKLNAAILALRANGEYKQINDQYFSFDVYGK